MNDFSNCRILVIDDDDDACFLLKCLLEKLCQVDVVFSPNQGIHFAQKNVPDLILLDINLPEIDGFKVCRELRSQAETANIPIIFITASSELQDMVQGFAAGAVDYLRKPFEIAAVNARVTAHLRQHLISREKTQRLGKLSQALAALEQSYLFFADNSADVLVRCGPDGTIRHINRQWTVLTGLEGGNPINQPVENLAVKEDRALVGALLDEAIQDGRDLLRIEFAVPTPHKPCPVQAAFLLRRASPNGHCLEINVVLSDVSDIMGSDSSFSAMKAGVSAMAAAQIRYLENISHEIRTPLNAIRGSVAALEDETRFSLQGRDALDILSSETQKLESLLTAMLAARPETPDTNSTEDPRENSVLIVDDVPVNIKVLHLAMKSLGFKSIEAVTSGEDGWESWQKSFHDIVLLDYRMGGMSGYDLCRLIRAHEKGKTPVIIGISANALPENEALAMEAGFDFQLPKPVSRLKLSNVLRGLGINIPRPPGIPQRSE